MHFLIHILQELSLRLAEREGARIVLATDPDADRLAVAEQCDKSVIFTVRHANSYLCLLMYMYNIY